jgi:hypothetical protein
MFTLVLLTLVTTASTQEYPEVTTPLGQILGTTLTTRLNKTIYAFRGIRYAQPPIKNLRFQVSTPTYLLRLRNGLAPSACGAMVRYLRCHHRRTYLSSTQRRPHLRRLSSSERLHHESKSIS